MRPRSLGAGLTIAVAGLLVSLRGSAQVPPYKDVAIDAAKWIKSTRVATPFGIAWPSDPNNPRSVSTALYSGSPRVGPFMLGMYRPTRDAARLDEAPHAP